MYSTSVGVAPSGECLRSKGRYGLRGWQVTLCDPLAIGTYLSTLEMRSMTKHYTNRRSLPSYFPDTHRQSDSILTSLYE